jgi:hypothetical protein
VKVVMPISRLESTSPWDRNKKIRHNHSWQKSRLNVTTATNKNYGIKENNVITETKDKNKKVDGRKNFTQICVKKKRKRELNGISNDGYKIVGNMIMWISSRLAATTTFERCVGSGPETAVFCVIVLHANISRYQCYGAGAKVFGLPASRSKKFRKTLLSTVCDFLMTWYL